MAAFVPGDLIGEVEVFTAGVRNDPQGVRTADPECFASGACRFICVFERC